MDYLDSFESFGDFETFEPQNEPSKPTGLIKPELNKAGKSEPVGASRPEPSGASKPEPVGASKPESLDRAISDPAHLLRDLTYNLKQLTPANLLPEAAKGIATQIRELDQFLFSRGIPRGDLSLFSGFSGCGATLVWSKAAQECQKAGQAVAWISGQCDLFPWGVGPYELNKERLFFVRAQGHKKEKLFWLLQEMITSRLFALIGCHDWPDMLQNHQLMKLKKLARQNRVSLVFIENKVRKFFARWSVWSCSIEFTRDFITVHRAEHRPTPFIISGRVLYDYFVPYLGITRSLGSSKRSKPPSFFPTESARELPKSLEFKAS